MTARTPNIVERKDFPLMHNNTKLPSSSSSSRFIDQATRIHENNKNKHQKRKKRKVKKNPVLMPVTYQQFPIFHWDSYTQT